jgi:hypothetical protein
MPNHQYIKIAQASLDLYEEAKKQGLPSVTSEVVNDQTRTLGMNKFIGAIMSGIMTIAALLVFFYLIWGAIDWILAGGDSGKVQKARDKMTQAAIGLIVLSATTAIFMLLQKFIGIEVITFGNPSWINLLRRN